MLDISITNIDKVLKTEEQIENFLNSVSFLEEKTDGVKLTVIRKDADFDLTKGLDNFIFAYKNNLIITEEFIWLNRETIKKESIGISQFALVLDHFRKNMENLSEIPKNTEFLIEFLMNKPTITRDYYKKHAMVLIGYAPTSYRINNMRVYSKPEKFQTENNYLYAKQMQIDVPKILYNGVPREMLTSKSPVKALQEFKEYILNIPSAYGGKIEGVVTQYSNQPFKILQMDQHDPLVRMEKKLRYKMSDEDETLYFEQIHEISNDVVADLKYDNEYKKIISNLNRKVFEIHTIDYPKHSKKSELNVRDDIFLTSKMKLMRLLPGNDNALFLGRIQPPTKMHVKIIEDGLKIFDNVVVAIVKGKKSDKDKNPFPFELQKKMLLEKFPNIEIIQVGTGNIFGIISKVEHNINSILAGSDRSDGYARQLYKNPGMSVQEITREDNGVSSTKVRQSILTHNYEAFKNNMDETHHKYWETLYFIIHPDELEKKIKELQKFESFEKYLIIKEKLNKF